LLRVSLCRAYNGCSYDEKAGQYENKGDMSALPHPHLLKVVSEYARVEHTMIHTSLSVG
jgi:hypothetical protein